MFEDLLSARLTAAALAAYPQVVDADPALRAATRAGFGDYQTSLALRLGSELGLPPRTVALRIVGALQVAEICSVVEVAGPGFINLTLADSAVIAAVNAMGADEMLGVERVGKPQRIVLDYSGPNVAKEMHVGHLRSTVIGDALARLLTHVGHEVIRQNHLGDWGTQFGMLIAQLEADGLIADDLDLAGLAALYQRAREHFDSDPEFAFIARGRVVDLQAGDPETVAAWQTCVEISLGAFDAVYSALGTLLRPTDLAAESSYNPMLAGVVADLDKAGLLTESGGALCAFPPGFSGRDGQPLPVLVRKADGGFGYDATDLAAIRHRVETLGATMLLYVVDARQSLHFEMLFAVARAVGWLPTEITARHVAFGSVIGDDGKPFKTRSGTTMKLSTLLVAARQQAELLLHLKGSTLPAEERSAVTRAIGIGAVKYADLSNDLGHDYVFSLARMIALDGNTGPYLQYAHARLCSLLDRAEPEVAEPAGQLTVLKTPAELRLAKALLGFPTAVIEATNGLAPHVLCAQLFLLAQALSTFYAACPVLIATGETRASRLALCRVAVRALTTGLGLLGIDSPSRM